MIEVGVRELKNNLSAYLRRVTRGEHVRVTMRGRPVAELLPTGRSRDEDPALRRLEAEGKITISRVPRPSRSVPRRKTPRHASRYVLEEREAER